MVRTDVTADPGKPEITVTKVFDAPLHQVYRACVDPKIIPKWWGMQGYTTTIDQMDFRPGGSYRFVVRGPQGEAHVYHGVYHSIVPDRRAVLTVEYEGKPDHVSLETVTFEERNDQTTVTEKSVFQSLEDRDSALNSGMQQDVASSAERLAALLH